MRFTTNTDSVAPAALADRLARLGFPASEEELVTPIAVAERLFASSPQARVLAGYGPAGGDAAGRVQALGRIRNPTTR